MTNCIFSWLNWVDAALASIEADAEAGDLVAENLRERQGYKVWRTEGLSEGDTDAGFDVDFGTAREIGVLALVFPRSNDPNLYDQADEFAATDTVRHRLSALSAGGDDVYDSGVVQSGVLAGYGYHAVTFDEAVTARYWRVDLDAISRASLGYVDMVRIWAGPTFVPGVGFSFGDNTGWSSDSAVTRASRGVAEFADSIEPVRTWSFQLDGLTGAEFEDMLEFERRVAASGQFLVGRTDIAAGKRWMLARQQQSLGMASLAYARNTKGFRLVESL